MRKIDHGKLYSEKDVWFIRQAGFPNGEDMIRMNAEEFGGTVTEPETPSDQLTKPVLGTEAGVVITPEGVDSATSAARLVVPVEPQPDVELPPDDYEQWKVDELDEEVTARNNLENTTNVEVVGSGKDGKVLKADLVKGLRLWDQENPKALIGNDEE